MGKRRLISDNLYVFVVNLFIHLINEYFRMGASVISIAEFLVFIVRIVTVFCRPKRVPQSDSPDDESFTGSNGFEIHFNIDLLKVTRKKRAPWITTAITAPRSGPIHSRTPKMIQLPGSFHRLGDITASISTT